MHYLTVIRQTSNLNIFLSSYVLGSGLTTALAGYYGKSYIDNLISDYTTTVDLTTLLSSHVLSSGLTTALSGFYSKAYIDNQINNYG